MDELLFGVGLCALMFFTGYILGWFDRRGFSKHHHHVDWKLLGKRRGHRTVDGTIMSSDIAWFWKHGNKFLIQVSGAEIQGEFPDEILGLECHLESSKDVLLLNFLISTFVPWIHINDIDTECTTTY